MKRIFLISLVLTMLCQIVYSQESNESLIRSIFLEIDTSEISIRNNNRAGNFLNTLFNVSNNYEFRNKIIKGTREQIKEIDELGYVHERHEQYYKGIKIEYSDIRTHYLNDLLVLVNGEYIDIPTIDISIVISEETAIQKAKEHIGARQYMWEDEADNNWLKNIKNDPTASFYPKPEIVICMNGFDIQDTIFYVAYKMNIYAKYPLSRNYVYVNAVNGKILDIEPIIKNVNGTAATRYSGTCTISTQLNGSTYRLVGHDGSRKVETYNMLNGTDYNSAVDFTNSTTTWILPNNKDNGALDAHWGAMMTYDYFKNVHKRNSYNNNGGVLKNYVHANLIAMGFSNNNNAFWNDECMTYGDGTSWDIVTSLDIVAHEIGHGVCEFSAELLYKREFGAINEGLSDIWAACVQNYAAPEKNIWLNGDEISYSGTPIRNMSNPKACGQPSTYKGDNWYPWCLIADDNNDYCGVHTNSGVMNYWFYLLSEGGSGTNDNNDSYNIEGICIENAAEIVYRAETKYMTKRTNFSDARKHTLRAAEELYGENSCEVQRVMNAWHAVGVGNKFSCGTKQIDNKIYSSGTTTKISDCKVEISNTTIQSGATVKVDAINGIKLTTGTKAQKGSYFHATVKPPCEPCNIQNRSMLSSALNTNGTSEMYYFYNVNDSAMQKNEYNDFYRFEDAATQKSSQNDLQTIEENQNRELILHPNPNTGTFTLSTNFDPQEVVSVKVFSPVGIAVYQQAGLPSNTIQLPSGAKGLFWVEVITQNQKFVRKVVVK